MTVDNDTVVDIPALVAAVRLLFGADTAVTAEFLVYMQPKGLKAAFREQAMRNHPDLAAQLGVSPAVLHQRFTRIRQAYELLLPFVSGRKKFPFRAAAAPAPTSTGIASRRPATPHPAAAPRPPAAAAAPRRTYFRGRMPERPLRFGEFLYYSKLIAWEDLLAAIVWQRQMRPRLRDIALEKGILTARDMLTIARARRPDEMLWATAVRLRFLDERQLRLLVAWRRLQGYPIGRYFCEKKLLFPAQVENMLIIHRRHNMMYTACLNTAKVG